MSIRGILAALALLTLSIPTRATTFATDASDLWYNPSESGWGVNIIQQHEILFATLFVYGAGSQAAWYVAPATAYTSSPGGVLNYSGPLYQTTGPFFGGAFDPNAVVNRQVGTMTFSFDTISTATLTYSVDGTIVSKRISRQTWRVNNLSGTYVGATVGTYSGCQSNGYQEYAAVYTVSQNIAAGTITVVETSSEGTCTFVGPYTQEGRMGRAAGSVNCPGAAGTFSAFEIEGSITAVTARVTSRFGDCTFTGRFGGLARGP